MSESFTTPVQVPVPQRNSGVYTSATVDDPLSDAIQYAEYSALLFLAALLVAQLSPKKLPTNPLRWHVCVATHATKFALPRYYVVLFLLVASAISILATVILLLSRLVAGG